ncbi:hypothetical protein PILCRDRAFT_819580 [Piloderma croceum F 1598]|uniref:Uncharacterized protein n=1 Tax=Piloderma croceum (strain F 1598) TaxID=765440 RepID=A0A0C3FV47_PILCF|nr:hypothetical protein PILCRDRAFT_819580 [Piloderma croceum F 1598]
MTSPKLQLYRRFQNVAWNTNGPTLAMGSNELNNNFTTDSHRSSPSLLGDHDDPPRPIHKRSTSSPSTSLTFLFQRLAVEARNKGQGQSHRKVSVSPTRRRLFKRQTSNVPHKMDLADGQAGHDKVKELSLCAFYHRKPLGTCPCRV